MSSKMSIAKILVLLNCEVSSRVERNSAKSTVNMPFRDTITFRPGMLLQQLISQGGIAGGYHIASFHHKKWGRERDRITEKKWE